MRLVDNDLIFYKPIGIHSRSEWWADFLSKYIAKTANIM